MRRSITAGIRTAFSGENDTLVNLHKIIILDLLNVTKHIEQLF